MKAKKEGARGAWRFAVIYAICFLLLLIATTQMLLGALRKSAKEQVPSEPESIYVYMPQESTEEDPKESEPLPEEPSEGYLVKEYQGKIGIFSTDGLLLEIIDTYVKTLPKSDQNLLKEGIYLEDERELLELIQDYS